MVKKGQGKRIECPAKERSLGHSQMLGRLIPGEEVLACKDEAAMMAEESPKSVLLSYLLNFCTAAEEFSIISPGTKSGIEDVDWESCKCVYGCYLGQANACSAISLPAHMHMSKLRKLKCYWKRCVSWYEGLFATLSFSCSESYTIFTRLLIKITVLSFILMQGDRKILFTTTCSNLFSLKHFLSQLPSFV